MEPRAYPDAEPHRRRWPIVALVVLVLAVPVTIVWATVSWTDSSNRIQDHADAVALASAGALRDAVANGSTWERARAKAHEAADAEMRSAGLLDGEEVAVSVEGTTTASMSVRVEVRRSGLTSGLANLVARDDVTRAVAVAALRDCKDTPHLA